MRPPVAADAEEVFASYTQDLDVARYMVWMPHPSVEAARLFINSCVAAWHDTDRRPYVIADRSSGQLLGMLEARTSEHGVNIGYVLAKPHWGQGLMPEAVSGLVHVALHELGFFRVEASCDAENHASARVLEKCGFIKEGRLARFIVHPNLSPEPRDCWLYAITR